MKTWGTPREEADLKNHVDLVLMLEIADLDSGTAVAGTDSIPLDSQNNNVQRK